MDFEISEMKFPESQHPSDATTIELRGEEYWPLSGKPYFHLVLGASHLKGWYHMGVPIKMSRYLPSEKIPTLLTYKGKDWEMVYDGESSRKKFDLWKTFAVDNKLKIGDACVFELTECSTKLIKLRAQILRGDIPPELEDCKAGESVNTPVLTCSKLL